MEIYLWIFYHACCTYMSYDDGRFSKIYIIVYSRRRIFAIDCYRTIHTNIMIDLIIFDAK